MNKRLRLLSNRIWPIKPYLAHQNVNAISVGVITNGKTWTKNFGTLDAEGTRSPNEKTLYEIGSISKVFTSVLLAEAVESGRLKLDDPISTVMKELAEKNPTVGNTITFQHLSHHVSGLPVMPDNIKPKGSTNPFDGYDRAMLTEYMLSAKPARKPGEGYGYQSMMLVIRQADCAVVLLCNTAGSGTDALAEQIIQAVMGLNVQPRTFDKEFKVDPEVAKRLEGKYKLTLGIVITVQVKDGRMMAQLTGQQFRRAGQNEV